MKSIFSIILFTFCALNIFAQIDNFPYGARSAGMGNASVTMYDIWGVSHNQAGIAKIEKPTFGLNHENKFIMSELGNQSLAFVMPTKSGNFGLSLSYFGFSDYNDSKIGLAYGKKLGEKISVGIQFDYLHTYIPNNYGSKNTFVGEIGIIAEPLDNLFIGAHVYNPTMSQVADYDNERIPTVFKLGLGYKFSEKLYFAAETEKDVDFKPTYKVGIEYMLSNDLYLRTGISTNPVQNSFGIGYLLNRLKLDLSFYTHPQLGFTPHISMIYELK